MNEHGMKTVTVTEQFFQDGSISFVHASAECACGLQPFHGRSKEEAIALLACHMELNSAGVSA